MLAVVVVVELAAAAEVAVAVAVVVIVSTTARVSPQWALVVLDCLLIATYAMVPVCVKGKPSLTALTSPLLRHLRQVLRSSDVSPISRMGTCYTLQIALQGLSNGASAVP